MLTITRQKQVKEKMPGLRGSFTCLELGEAMDLERLLAETPGTLPSFAALARHFFFTATGHTQPSTEGAAEVRELLDCARPRRWRVCHTPREMKRIEYEEETVERVTSYLETLVAKRDNAGNRAKEQQSNVLHSTTGLASLAHPRVAMDVDQLDPDPKKPVVVVETKGLHLKNEATDYKRKLFEMLERHSNGGVPVGGFVWGTRPARCASGPSWKAIENRG